MPREHLYYAYIMSNDTRNIFYIGCTNNLVRRVIEHSQGIGSQFTKKYKLRCLVYYEEYQYIQEAIEREKQLKGWRRDRKISLIVRHNPRMKDLGIEIFDSFSIKEDDIEEIAEGLKEKYYS